MLLAMAFLGGLTFVVFYATTARWWRSDVGRNAMIFAGCETIILGLSLTVRIFGDFPGRELVAMTMFALFTVAIWWRVVALIRAQRRKD